MELSKDEISIKSAAIIYGVPEFYVREAYYKELNRSLIIKAFPDINELHEYMLYYVINYCVSFDLSTLTFDPPV